MKKMTDQRVKKFTSVVQKRQLDMTVVLENVHDPHNIGAVLRSCDAVGISEIFVLYNEPNLFTTHLKVAGKSNSGARKWVDINFYTDTDKCMKAVRSKYQTIYATHLENSAESIYNKDLTQSFAIVFGNEKDGISAKMLEYCNQNVVIPQMGMVKSLNISVACAVSLFEALRQRQIKGLYSKIDMPSAKVALLNDYCERHHDRKKRNLAKRID
jgi:tRNA (guanosine-2'-O-)-methyltransferase